MGYLSRIHIVDVEEVGVDGVQKGANPHIVYLDGVVDYDNNPWEPVPGPDPWDDLVKAQAPLVVGNNFNPGTTISGQTGTFVGGNPDTTIYRYRWRWRPMGGNWTNGTWTNTTNDTIAVTYDIPADHWGYQIQLQSQARDDTQDPVLQVINNSQTKVTVYEPIAVDQRTTTTGNRFAGETLTGTLATYTGGEPPVTEEYQWQISDDGSGGWQGLTNWTSATSQSSTTKTYKLTTAEVGKYVRFAGRANDAGGNIAYGSGNSVGPIQQYTIGTVTGYIDGVEYDPQETVDPVMQGSSSVLTVIASGNSPNISYSWTVRQGDVRITPSGNMCTIVHQSEPPQGEQVQCDVIDNNALDDNKAVRFAFLVSE